MIYPTLISKIKTSLEAVDSVKEVFNYPRSKLSKYPSIVFFPNGLDNEYNNTGENLKTYKFSIFLVIGAIQTTIDTVYNTIMPKALDEVLAQLDKDWNTGTIDGHRAWSQVETGSWSLSTEQNSIELTAELTLNIKVLTNN